MGGNFDSHVERGWTSPKQVDGKPVLDRAKELGIMVTVGLWLAPTAPRL